MNFESKGNGQLLVIEARRLDNSNLVIYANVSDESVTALDERSKEDLQDQIPTDEELLLRPENQELYRKLLKYHKLVLYSLSKQYQYNTDKEEFSSILVSELNPDEGSISRATTPRTTNVSIEGGKRVVKKRAKLSLPVEVIYRSLGSLRKWRPSLKRKRNKEEA